MEKLSKLIKILGYLDYAMSAALLAYGLFAPAWLYAAAGAVGLVLAYLKPAERLKSRLTAKFVCKTGSLAQPAHEGGLPAVQLRYTARSRYPAAHYFVGYTGTTGASRMSLAEPRNLCALLSMPVDRLRLGVCAEKIHPR
jgi:hypothetical protein